MCELGSIVCIAPFVSCCLLGSVGFIQKRWIIVIVVYNLFIMLHSSSLLDLFRRCVFILLTMYCIAPYLCSCGWHESLGIIISVMVGFRFMLKKFSATFLRCDAEEIDRALHFFLYSKFHCWCYVFERIEDFIYVRGGDVVYY